GRWGRTFEINSNEDVVWEYVTPVNFGNQASQGDTLTINSNLTFRMKRYDATYGAFEGRTLTAGGYLEANPDTTGCPLPILAAPDASSDVTALFPNPAQDRIFIDRRSAKTASVELFDIVGNRVRNTTIRGLRDEIRLDGLTPGVYFIRVDHASVGKIVIQ
ncbi:MAG: T9SS type A sorting domain-containing protein, partial [Bacteroidota bacterium]